MSSKRVLPVLTPIAPRSFAWFDLTSSAPVALSTLRARIGLPATARVALRVVGLGLVADPTRALPRPTSTNEELALRQLRSVLLLAAALERSFDRGTSREHVRAVVRASGTAFLDRFFADFSAEDWDAASDASRAAFARGLSTRIVNATLEGEVADASGLRFEVRRCTFVGWLGALGRADLAPLFCEVDAAFAERPGTGMRLVRPTTLAAGDDRCRFRFERTDP